MATETRERITDPERLSRLEGAHLHMATKADLAAFETRVMARIAESDEKRAESEIRLMAMIASTNDRVAETNDRIASTNGRIASTNERIAETNARIVETNARIVAFESRIIKWVVGVGVTLFAAFASLAIGGGALLYRLLSS